ncbi:MAG TPA: hypothetical protein VN081_00135 [Dongiaceae bacterium]|jgi:hypothetical protein|nr:hypothetical protein [Dongiaceae bacterium]
MPTLPTFTVTQAQADRLLAAYGSVDNYKAWLKEQIIEYVVEVEGDVTFAQARDTVNANDASLRADLANAT